MTKYKYSHSELFHAYISDKVSYDTFKWMILAKAPARQGKKECKHELGDVEVHDNEGAYHVAGDTCKKCGMHMLDWSTPQSEQGKKVKEIEFIELDCNQRQMLRQGESWVIAKVNEIVEWSRQVNSLLKNK